jgi:DNA-binding MarR family transcriptional regulator
MDEEQESALFELADLILAISRHIHASKESAAGSGTSMEGAVMRFVDRHPGTTAGAAAEATQLISSNFSRTVRGLEEKGLVRRAVDQHDGRLVRLYPTDLAHENLQRLRAAWSRLLDGTVDDPGEIEGASATLRRIEARLVAGDRDAASHRE